MKGLHPTMELRYDCDSVAAAVQNPILSQSIVAQHQTNCYSLNSITTKVMWFIDTKVNIVLVIYHYTFPYLRPFKNNSMDRVDIRRRSNDQSVDLSYGIFQFRQLQQLEQLDPNNCGKHSNQFHTLKLHDILNAYTSCSA